MPSKVGRAEPVPSVAPEPAPGSDATVPLPARIEEDMFTLMRLISGA